MNDPSFYSDEKQVSTIVRKEISVKPNRNVYAVSYLGRRFLLSSGSKKFKCVVELHFWERIEFDNASKKQTMGVDL